MHASPASLDVLRSAARIHVSTICYSRVFVHLKCQRLQRTHSCVCHIHVVSYGIGFLFFNVSTTWYSMFFFAMCHLKCQRL